MITTVESNIFYLLFSIYHNTEVYDSMCCIVYSIHYRYRVHTTHCVMVFPFIVINCVNYFVPNFYTTFRFSLITFMYNVPYYLIFNRPQVLPYWFAKQAKDFDWWVEQPEIWNIIHSPDWNLIWFSLIL